MFGDTIEAWDHTSEAITPAQRDAGKIAMAKAAVAKSNPFGKKVTDKSSKAFARKTAKDSIDDPLALKADARGKISRAGVVKDSTARSRKIPKPNLPENSFMFGDLLEAYDDIVEDADPAAKRLGFRLSKGITNRGSAPGNPARSLGMNQVSAKDKKGPPPPRIPKGTKLAGQDLSGSKEEGTFAEFSFGEARTKDQHTRGQTAASSQDVRRHGSRHRDADGKTIDTGGRLKKALAAHGLPNTGHSVMTKKGQEISRKIGVRSQISPRSDARDPRSPIGKGVKHFKKERDSAKKLAGDIARTRREKADLAREGGRSSGRTGPDMRAFRTDKKTGKMQTSMRPGAPYKPQFGSKK